ncbi:polyphenol oxidase family protein [Dethiosulfovibrio salsuginis]|uniref:Purine nucleoside phosphorylase n=1 Tax=Dethiosulfovibrio salsuginis TaxID=561720 RepID=A0A1X7I476_9BACT|nr:polyphenol oxidase family protein [Dethiosulfovibrio salsuginis]SMG09232.1 conserved hypothetical protein [Dethiosulfovibrio salsuginis]
MIPRFVESSIAGLPAMDLILDEEVKGRLFLKNDLLSPQKYILEKVVDPRYRIISPLQVHGNVILTDGPSLPDRPEGDGILLTKGDTVASIQVADCFPVLISSGAGTPWRLALHSGFKGTIENIVASGLEIARVKLNVDTKNSFAWIGPGIGPCCYGRKLDDPWTQKAMKTIGYKFFSVDGNVVFFDLPCLICHQLMELGIPSENIVSCPDCTSCREDKFFSYRKGWQKERMVLLTYF